MPEGTPTGVIPGVAHSTERARAAGLARVSFAQALALETASLTAAYWASALLFVAAFWVTTFPPLIDYPQHVAVGAILRRLADPSSVERDLYDVNLFTYNGGFHLMVAALSFLVQPETAGRLLLSVYPLALAYASLSLMRVADRPRWYALLILPITMSFAVGWGFANYFLSVPLVLLAFAWWLRMRRGEKRFAWAVMAASFFLSYTHVLATLCLCVTIGVAGLLSLPDASRGWRARVVDVVKLPLAVWPAIAWSTAVFVHNRHSPHANWEGWDDGLDDPVWYKLVHALGYAVGNFSDHSDQLLLAFALALLVALYRWPSSKTPPHRVMGGLAVLWGALYCVVPKVFIATWFIFERFPTFVLVFAVAATPVVLGTFTHERWFRVGAAALALGAAVNTVVHFGLIPDEKDANAILEDIPAGRRVIAVTWSNTGHGVILREMWVHLLAYYQARRPGEIAYSFAKFESMPVHYAVGKRPPVIPGGMEWDATKYDISQPYARYWDLVMVRTPDEDPASDPAVRTFGPAAVLMKVLSHRGRFWLYDASALREISFVVGSGQRASASEVTPSSRRKRPADRQPTASTAGLTIHRGRPGDSGRLPMTLLWPSSPQLGIERKRPLAQLCQFLSMEADLDSADTANRLGSAGETGGFLAVRSIVAHGVASPLSQINIPPLRSGRYGVMAALPATNGQRKSDGIVLSGWLDGRGTRDIVKKGLGRCIPSGRLRSLI